MRAGVFGSFRAIKADHDEAFYVYHKIAAIDIKESSQLCNTVPSELRLIEHRET